MSSLGTGYDLSSTTFSPDGHVFQVEYAGKAVDLTGTCLGVRCSDGVLLAAEKLVPSKLLVEGANRRVLAVDKHHGAAVAGVYPDARKMVVRARNEGADYKLNYGSEIPTKVLSDRLSLFVQQYTLYGHVRPFGSSLILGGFTPGAHSRPEIYMVDPSGLSYGYYAIAVGKGQLPAKTELEKLGLAGMTCAQAVPHLARIIMGVHDDVKDKPYELEMGWVTEETGRVYQQVPPDVVRAAREQARREREEAEMEDDDDE
eukprot:TRINITY_DN4155_c2_g1_i1.p1 TRINITY_DN4155_c2_g1~~TRINITY_DN4155_c2_g1_i1.p1  ORF type:complete len:269 (+),score=139.60 TRINITY_DN4155_c2_g1_i1:35-808(+)